MLQEKKFCMPHSPFLMRTANKSNMNRVTSQVANQYWWIRKWQDNYHSLKCLWKTLCYNGYERQNGSSLLVIHARRVISSLKQTFGWVKISVLHSMALQESDIQDHLCCSVSWIASLVSIWKLNEIKSLTLF